MLHAYELHSCLFVFAAFLLVFWSVQENLSVASEAVEDAANACDRSSRDLVQENERRADSVAALTAAADLRTQETMREAEKQVKHPTYNCFLYLLPQFFRVFVC